MVVWMWLNTVIKRFSQTSMDLKIEEARPHATNKRNIYFGLIMGVSAMLPTCGHVFILLRFFFVHTFNKRLRRQMLLPKLSDIILHVNVAAGSCPNVPFGTGGRKSLNLCFNYIKSEFCVKRWGW